MFFTEWHVSPCRRCGGGRRNRRGPQRTPQHCRIVSTLISALVAALVQGETFDLGAWGKILDPRQSKNMLLRCCGAALAFTESKAQ